jgi:hypothetical protein
MQLPHDLQHFHEPTLILIADHVRAHLWLAGGDALESLEGLSMPIEADSDREGSFQSTDTRMSHGPESKAGLERMHRYIHLLLDRLEQELRTGRATKAMLVADADLLHPLLGHLPGDLEDRVTKTVEGNYIKSDVLEVVRLLTSTNR